MNTIDISGEVVKRLELLQRVLQFFLTKVQYQAASLPPFFLVNHSPPSLDVHLGQVYISLSFHSRRMGHDPHCTNWGPASLKEYKFSAILTKKKKVQCNLHYLHYSHKFKLFDQENIWCRTKQQTLRVKYKEKRNKLQM